MKWIHDPEPVVFFNTWRERYSTLSDEEWWQFNQEVARRWPVQYHTHKELCRGLIERAAPKKVWEIGGWAGDLAQDMLREFPDIESWVNWDVTSVTSRCFDPRYSVEIQPRFDWWNYRDIPESDLTIIAHVIEHLREYHVRELVPKLTSEFVYVECPIQMDKGDPHNWEDYTASHVLEIGWKDLDRLFQDCGYHHINLKGDVRWYQRGE